MSEQVVNNQPGHVEQHESEEQTAKEREHAMKERTRNAAPEDIRAAIHGWESKNFDLRYGVLQEELDKEADRRGVNELDPDNSNDDWYARRDI